MKVSIIIPFYYGNKYINKLLNVLNNNYIILNKNLNVTMEVIIVNDSPNEIINIHDKDRYTFDLLIESNTTNIGIHKTRIHGLNISTGDYILFLDQDDDISNDYIYSQMSKIKEKDFIISNGFSENNTKQKIDIYKNLRQQKLCLDLMCHYCLTNPIISPGQVIIKKDAIPNEWIEYSFLNNGADDHYLWLLLLEKNKKGEINENKIYTHKFTGENTSLNENLMTESNFELLNQLHGKISKWKYILFKRRLCYWKNKINKKNYFMYLDAALIKYIYKIMIWNR